MQAGDNTIGPDSELRRGVTESTWDFNALGLVVARSERRGSS